MCGAKVTSSQRSTQVHVKRVSSLILSPGDMSLDKTLQPHSSTDRAISPMGSITYQLLLVHAR